MLLGDYTPAIKFEQFTFLLNTVFKLLINPGGAFSFGLRLDRKTFKVDIINTIKKISKIYLRRGVNT